jgi:hypothetical protein
VNEATRKALDILRKAGKDSSKLGKVFRPPFEPSEGDNDRKGLAEALNRDELGQAYLESAGQPNTAYFSLMKNQVQNDFVAPIHRDLAFRYSSRIRRIAEEAGRRAAISKESEGLVDTMELSMADFLSLDKGAE